MRARIYRPARNAMQSGSANTRRWVLEFLPSQARHIDPLMRWIGSADTETQLRLRFDTLKAAQEFAREHGIDAVVTPPHDRKPNIRPGGYGDNFAHTRRQPWTH
ncbi:MAG: ETC complex I subunit [Alphaproteobacteria bacterium]|nr:MAG: ETC complex I subunit [Alphaproteobacteria bacterium]